MQSRVMIRIVITSVLMLCAAAYVGFSSHGEAVPLKKPLSAFPQQVGSWQGKEGFFDERVYQILGVDESALRFYHNSKGEQIELYVGFYGSQREGDIIHSPRNCMPGAGWVIIDSSLETIALKELTSRNIKVIRLILAKGSQKQVVLYWFQSRGRYISSEYYQKLYLIWDAILKNRTDGSFVRLISPAYNENIDEATAVLKTFAAQIIPILDEYLPGSNL